MSREQAHAFEKALKLPSSVKGALPQEIHDAWKSLPRGPGASAQRNALRNAIMPRDARYGHLCNVDPEGALMKQVKKKHLKSNKGNHN